MRTIVSLSVLLTAFAAATCQYSPSAGSVPGSAVAPTAERATPEANVPHGDVYFETYIGRYDLRRDP